MPNKTKKKLFFVDDDLLFLKSLEIEFYDHPDFTTHSFSTGELCIENLSLEPDIIILDYHLDTIKKDAINGIQTLNKIREFNNTIPVIILSSQDKIDVAVSCMHHGAYDYVVKSETAFMRLHKIMTAIFYHRKIENQLDWYMKRM
jgi:DNA-binding NtrC family response regulator